jgi:hypothetical protein
MNRLWTIQYLMAALLFLAACATPVPPAEKTAVLTKPPAAPTVEQVTPPRLTEDSALFAEGIALLNQPDRSDAAKARAVFVSLRERYPQSRWRLAAETLIRLIDRIAALQEENRRDRLLAEQVLAEQIRKERAVAMQENEALQKRLREQTEKLQKELTALVQENEKLRKDLQQLKALEIELERRERMLR